MGNLASQYFWSDASRPFGFIVPPCGQTVWRGVLHVSSLLGVAKCPGSDAIRYYDHRHDIAAELGNQRFHHCRRKHVAILLQSFLAINDFLFYRIAISNRSKFRYIANFVTTKKCSQLTLYLGVSDLVIEYCRQADRRHSDHFRVGNTR
jgi:hypothetical protein